MLSKISAQKESHILEGSALSLDVSSFIPTGNYMLKVNRNATTRCELWACFAPSSFSSPSVSIVKFEEINAGWDLNYSEVIEFPLCYFLKISRFWIDFLIFLNRFSSEQCFCKVTSLTVNSVKNIENMVYEASNFVLVFLWEMHFFIFSMEIFCVTSLLRIILKCRKKHAFKVLQKLKETSSSLSCSG